jgi:hypothetical protein
MAGTSAAISAVPPITPGKARKNVIEYPLFGIVNR